MGQKFEHSHQLRRAKTGAGRRALDAKLPKIIESPKSLLLLYGHSTSNIGKVLLSDLHMLKKPYCNKLTRRNELLPFEFGGETHLENLCRLNDCSLFALTNHTKKRPDNLIIGRTFGFRILDMFEFGIEHFQPLQTFKDTLKSTPGSSPLIVFNGEDYNASDTTRTMQSLLFDVFRGPDDVKSLNLAGVDRVIVFTLQGHLPDDPDAPPSTKNPLIVQFKQYGISLKRMRRTNDNENNETSADNSQNGTDMVDEDNVADGEEKDASKSNEADSAKEFGLLPSLPAGLPRVELTEVGPRFDLKLRRKQLAPEGMKLDAMKKPRDPTVVKKKKNISRDDMGDKLGRIHVGRQDLSSLSLARMKGLGKKRKLQVRDESEGQGDVEMEDADGKEEGIEGAGLSPSKKARADGDSVET